MTSNLTLLKPSQVICPPNSNWRDNVQIAINCDAAAIITDVLKLHPGDEDVLDRCSAALAHLCYDAGTAEQIAEQGAVDAVLASIDANSNLPAESSECLLRFSPNVMGCALVMVTCQF